MGEAKWRKANDPTWGKPKPADPPARQQTRKGIPELASRERGIVISNPMTIQNNSIHVQYSGLEAQELRYCLLFWDRLIWPSSRTIHLASGPDEQFLEAEKVLHRPDYTVWGQAGPGLASSHLRAFLDAEESCSGAWSISKGVETMIGNMADKGPQRAGLVKLFNCIPVPNQDVPLADILEFKNRRKAELEALRDELENLYVTLSGAQDQEAALRWAIDRVDRACADAIKSSREMFKIRLADVFASFASPLSDKTASALLGDSISMAALAGTGVAAAVQLGSTIGLRALEARKTPYRYVSRFHNEVFD